MYVAINHTERISFQLEPIAQHYFLKARRFPLGAQFKYEMHEWTQMPYRSQDNFK